MTTLTTKWTITSPAPFGLLATTDPGADLYAVPTPVLHTWVAENRIVILRGFEPLDGDALLEFCGTLGELMEWDLGPVEDNLADQTYGKSALSPGQEVPFHWDGAFGGQAPRYIFFHC